jgi:hypothetical protein
VYDPIRGKRNEGKCEYLRDNREKKMLIFFKLTGNFLRTPMVHSLASRVRQFSHLLPCPSAGTTSIRPAFSSTKTGFLIFYIRNENVKEQLREIHNLRIFRVVSIFGGYSSEHFDFSSIV